MTHPLLCPALRKYLRIRVGREYIWTDDLGERFAFRPNGKRLTSINGKMTLELSGDYFSAPGKGPQNGQFVWTCSPRGHTDWALGGFWRRMTDQPLPRRDPTPEELTGRADRARRMAERVNSRPRCPYCNMRHQGNC